jgi:integrating conjugative element protein (TIGR03761 family)
MSEEHNTEEKTVTKPGALQSSLSMALHTWYAIRLWEGRRRDEDNGLHEIVSMPQVIARAGIAWRDSAADNPYADAALVRIEAAIKAASDKIQGHVAALDNVLSGVPKGVTLSEVGSTHPLNIQVYSRSPLGYRCVWLLIGYDQLAMKVFQAFHFGLISRSQRDAWLDSGGHAVRKVYGAIRSYRTVEVNRDDIRNLTERGREAIARMGEPDPDIFSGKTRASISPPLPNEKR